MSFSAITRAASGRVMRAFVSMGFLSAVGSLLLVLLVAGALVWLFERKANPEQFGGGEMDRRVDVFAAGVVLWEALTSRRLFAGQDVAETLGRIASGKVEAPSLFRPEIPPALDAVLLRALASEREQRFPTAIAFAEAIEGAVQVASAREIGAWVESNAALGLDERSQRLSDVESSSHIVPKQVSLSQPSAPVSGRSSIPMDSPDLDSARTLVVAPRPPSNCCRRWTRSRSSPSTRRRTSWSRCSR